MILQVNSRNVQKFSLFKIWLDIKTVALVLSSDILKVPTKLLNIYYT